MQYCWENFERCLIIFLLLLIPCLMAGENLQTLLLKEQRGGAGRMNKQSLMEVEDMIPSISPSSLAGEVV